jgi:hypothetical protein
VTTARQLIKRALLINGALTKNQTPAADEANDALITLNAMLSSWSNESLLIYNRVLENFPLVAGDNTYTIGPSGDFNTSRPVQIVSAYVRDGSNDYYLDSIPDTVYDESIGRKTAEGYPEFFQYDYANPVGTIKLWPTPSSAFTLFIRSEKALTSFVLDDNITFPPGWEQALAYNLAVLLAPEYSQPVDATTDRIARDSLSSIKAAVARNRTMDTPPLSSITGFDVYRGDYP